MPFQYTALKDLILLGVPYAKDAIIPAATYETMDLYHQQLLIRKHFIKAECVTAEPLLQQPPQMQQPQPISPQQMEQLRRQQMQQQFRNM